MGKITVGVLIILYTLLQNAHAETPTIDSLARTILNNAKRPSRSPFQKMTHYQDTNNWDGFSTLCGKSITSQNFGCSKIVAQVGCSFDGKEYVGGDIVPKSIDETCTCQESGKIKCQPIDGSCVYNGKTYTGGNSFPSVDGCNECSCRRGTTEPICTQKGCSPIDRETKVKKCEQDPSQPECQCKDDAGRLYDYKQKIENTNKECPTSCFCGVEGITCAKHQCKPKQPSKENLCKENPSHPDCQCKDTLGKIVDHGKTIDPTNPNCPSNCFCSFGKITCARHRCNAPIVPPITNPVISSKVLPANRNQPNDEGCSINKSSKSSPFFTAILILLLGLVFSINKSTFRLTISFLLLLLIGMSCRQKSSEAEGQEIVAGSGFDDITLYPMNIALQKDHAGLFKVYFIETFKLSSDKKSRVPASLEDSNVDSNTLGLLWQWLKNDDVGEGTSDAFLDDPYLAIYRAEIDGNAITAKVVINPNKSNDPTYQSEVHFFANDGKGPILGKYLSTRYEDYNNYVATNIANSSGHEKELLWHRFAKQEFSYQFINNRDILGTIFDDADSVTQNDVLSRLQTEDPNALQFYIEKGFFEDVFNDNSTFGKSRADIWWNGIDDLTKYGRSRNDISGFVGILESYNKVKAVLNTQRKVPVSNTIGFSKQVYSLFLCGFDPISLQSTASRCEISHVTRSKTGIGKISLKVFGQEKTSEPNPKIILASAHSGISIKQTSTLWSYIVSADKSEIPEPWRNPSDGLFVGENDGRYTELTYPVRLFVQSPLIDCNPISAVLGGIAPETTGSFDIETWKCFNQEDDFDSECYKSGRYPIPRDQYYALNLSHHFSKGSAVSKKQIQERIDAIFRPSMYLHTDAIPDYSNLEITKENLDEQQRETVSIYENSTALQQMQYEFMRQEPKVCSPYPDVSHKTCPPNDGGSQIMPVLKDNFTQLKDDEIICTDYNGCYFGNDNGIILPLEDLKDFLSNDVLTRLSSMWSASYLDKHGKKYICMHGQSSLLNSDKSTAIRNLSWKVTRKKFRDDTGTIIPVPPPPSPPMTIE